MICQYGWKLPLENYWISYSELLEGMAIVEVLIRAVQRHTQAGQLLQLRVWGDYLL